MRTVAVAFFLLLAACGDRPAPHDGRSATVGTQSTSIGPGATWPAGAAAPEGEVSDFYISRAKAAGLNDSVSMAASGGHMRTAGNAATGESVTVRTSFSDGKTQAVLLVGHVHEHAG